MERLLRIFYNNGSFFTFCILQMVCLFFIVNSNSTQSAIAMETWSLRTGKIKSFYTSANSYLDLEEESNISRRSNARLMGLLATSRYSTVAEIDSIVDSTTDQRFNFLSTRIINKSPYGPNNTFVIDRGSDFGVEPGQGVMDSNGLLGIVDLVTAKHARVLSVLHSGARVSAGVETGHFGTLQWDGLDPRRMTVTAIPDFVILPDSAAVRTTGYSNVFPTNQIIGTVESAATQPGTGLQTLTIRLSNDPLTASTAYVVLDLFKEELSQLKER